MITKLFTVFHLNLAYSSIEEERRVEVIQRCYWPLLRLARANGVRLGLEAPGYTLEAIDALDPAWTTELRNLLDEGTCEFVGSGLVQLIGPLVPFEVNVANQRLGLATYERLLGRRPRVALVGEQAFSSGLVCVYRDAGYEAIVMEWDNAARVHPEWPAETRYLPQYARGPEGERIALIWNQSIAFQKFQRYAHGDLDLDEYLPYLASQCSATAPRAFALYGNDVEIFDFRPGRYHTEPAVGDGEWVRIERLFTTLAADGRFSLTTPAEVLALEGEPGAGRDLVLPTAAQPVPVKKQAKYNLTRWAVTGRDDVGCNTACWRLYDGLRAGGEADDGAWRDLCLLWSSDVRTHITQRRWDAYRARLGAALARIPAAPPPAPPVRRGVRAPLRVRRAGRYLEATGENVALRLNCRRGLAIDSLRLGPPEQPPQVGTLAHGYYADIALGADFYSGHVVVEVPGRPKVTDLAAVEPVVREEDGLLVVHADVPTPLGVVAKTMRLDAAVARLEIEYALDGWTLPQGSLRLGHVTLLPEAFSRARLFYRTRNGGRADETYPLQGGSVDHGAAASFLVSASQGLGMTTGQLVLGDGRTGVRVTLDRARAAGIGLLTYRDVGETFFCRLAISLRELDDTCRPGEPFLPLRFAMSITADPT